MNPYIGITQETPNLGIRLGTNTLAYMRGRLEPSKQPGQRVPVQNKREEHNMATATVPTTKAPAKGKTPAKTVTSKTTKPVATKPVAKPTVAKTPTPGRDSKGHFLKVDKAAAKAALAPEPTITINADATPTLAILHAVNDLLGKIRTVHPEVPNVSVVLGAQGATRRGQVHGHFSPNSWEHEDAKHEIMLSGESLQRGAAATLGTLLHECAHAVANVRGVKDTSNNGRYHNKRFKSIGEEFGLELQDAPTLGWSITSVPDETAAKYQAEVDALAKTLVAYRKPPAEKAKKPRRSTKFLIDCGCFDPVMVSKKWAERHLGSLRCDDCMEPFHETDDPEKGDDPGTDPAGW